MQKNVLIGALKSRTVWFNVFSVLAASGAMFTGVLTPDVLAVLVAVGNIGLRFLTSESLADKAPEE